MNRELKSKCYCIMVDKLNEIDPDVNTKKMYLAFTIVININREILFIITKNKNRSSGVL